MKILGTAVLIKPDKIPERTPSGNIYIPKNTKEMLPETGEVIQAGAACVRVKKGEQVQFLRKKASLIVIDEEDFFLINEHKVFYNERTT